jgi:hypothetical protein
MEGEWKQKYDEVLMEINVEKWIRYDNVCDWNETNRLRKIGRFWYWIGYQIYTIDQELEMNKRRE